MGGVWLTLVYAGSAAVAIGLASRFIRKVNVKWAVALSLLPFVLIGKAMVTGGYYGPLNLAYAVSPLSARGGPALHRDYRNGLLSDVAFQMVPWHAVVRNELRSGRIPFWNPSILCGDVLLGAAQGAPFHPSTIIGLLLPTATSRTFAAAFTLFLTSLGAFLFLSDLGLAPYAAFFGAAAWMLSLHFLFWTGWPEAQTFAVMPLLFAGVRRIARWIPGGLTTSVTALVLALLGGQPESAFHAAFVGGLYFLTELSFASNRLRAAGIAVGAVLIALALCAPVILPVIEAIPQTAEGQARMHGGGRTSDSMPEAVRSSVGAIFPDWYGGWLSTSSRSAPSFDLATAASVGGIALALAVVALLFSARRERWSLAAIAAVSLAVGVGAPGVADLVNRLPIFRLALNDRLTAATAFCLSALAALGLDALVRLSVRRALVLPAVAVGAALAALARRAALVKRGIDPAVFTRSMIFFCGGVSLIFVVWFFTRRNVATFIVVFVAAFLSIRTAETPRLSPTFRNVDFYPPLEELNRIPRSAPFRVVGLRDSFLPNQASLYALEDVRGYEALTNARFADTFPIWCALQATWFNRVDDPNRPFLTFLNARYLLTDPAAAPPVGWRLVARGASLAVWENPAALPRAFAPRRVRYVEDPATTVAEMRQYTNFGDVAWIESPGERSREVENGRAIVTVRQEGADLLLDIDAAAASWIVVSETNWKGWRALEGRSKLPLAFANHAFMALRVAPGRHHVRLHYRPGSFVAGLALAGAGLIATSVAARRNSLARDRRAQDGGAFIEV